MSLVAMIVVAREAHGAPPGLVATLPLVGRTLVEQQARRAAAAGADELILVVERLLPELAAAAERLRDAGLVVHLARGAAEAAGLALAAADLLLIADGVLPSDEALSTAASLAAPALLVLADRPGLEAWERIDAAIRWAGVARLRHADLVRTAAMLGDWDLELTLVRDLVGEAGRAVVAPAAVTAIRDRAAAAAFGAALADEVVAPGGAAPVGRGLLGWAMTRPVAAGRVRTAAAGAAVAGAILAAVGPLWLAAPPLLASAPLDRFGRRLAMLRREGEALGPGWVRARLAAFGAALPLFGWRLSGPGGFEPLLLALAALAFLLAARGEARLHALAPERWSARPEPMLWLAAACVIAGQGIAGLAALAAWTTVSFFRLQRRASRLLGNR